MFCGRRAIKRNSQINTGGCERDVNHRSAPGAFGCPLKQMRLCVGFGLGRAATLPNDLDRAAVVRLSAGVVKAREGVVLRNLNLLRTALARGVTTPDDSSERAVEVPVSAGVLQGFPGHTGVFFFFN